MQKTLSTHVSLTLLFAVKIATRATYLSGTITAAFPLIFSPGTVLWGQVVQPQSLDLSGYSRHRASRLPPARRARAAADRLPLREAAAGG